MKKLFVTYLRPEDFQPLSEASYFSELPSNLQNSFRNRNIRIPATAKVIDSKYRGLQYIIFNGDLGLKVFTLADDLSAEQSSIGTAVYDESPTVSHNLNDYSIYRTSVPLRDNGKVILINGKEREQLQGIHLKKWDYFFRASKHEIGYWHRRLIHDLDAELKIKKKEENQKFLQIGGIILVALIIYSGFWKILALPLIGFGLYKFRKLFFTLYSILQGNKVLKRSIVQLQSEIEFLEDQFSQSRVSEKEIRDCLNKEILALDKIAFEELGLDKKDILAVKPSLKYRGTAGLSIEEWALVQSDNTNGKKIIEKKHPFHLLGFRINNGRPIYSMYYLYFIYMTEDVIGIYGFFYDFILEKRFGTVTNQYFYRDIVSIGTVEKESIILNSRFELETKQIIVTFYNNEKITITLTDSVTIKSLSEQIQAKEKVTSLLNAPVEELEELTSSDDFQQLLTLADDSLPATRSNAILKNVKEYWDSKKQMTQKRL